MDEPDRGAYGFRVAFSGSTVPTRDLVELGTDAPLVTLSLSHGSPLVDLEEVSEREVRVQRRGGSAIYVRREPPSIHLVESEPPPPEALVHPLLAAPMSILARWRDDATLHAGAFETAAGAWAVAGQRESGKSTLLAWLAARGVPIVSDDLVTVADGRVRSGPRCVDLRPDVAARFPAARSIGQVAGRTRHRLSTPPSRDCLPLRGFFVLEWWDRPDVEVAPMAAREALRLVGEHEYIRLLGGPDPLTMLELAARPAWRVRRPRSWEGAQAAVDALLAEADQS